MGEKKRILIIDDHPLFREGLKSIIKQETKYEVVGEAGTGHEGVQAARELKPDMVLLDISLPDKSGIELIFEILQDSIQSRIFVISMHSKIDYVVKAFQSGAMGYIVKESAGDMLIKGMDQVFKGKFFMDPSISHEVLKRLMTLSSKESAHPDTGYDSLTAREQEIFTLLAEGMSMKQIADKLSITLKTAENHRATIMRKLGLHSAMDLIRYAAKLGVIDIDALRE